MPTAAVTSDAASVDSHHERAKWGCFFAALHRHDRLPQATNWSLESAYR
jgi:hypothetical protein